MKMTDVERITLIRLHEILSILKPKEAKEHQTAIEILRDGYHEDLYEDAAGSCLSEPFSEKNQKFVYDVLDLYVSLGRSYGALSKQEKKKIDKALLRFPGFDGNNEAAHLAFAKFVVKKQGRWSDIDCKAGFNSDSPMLETYKIMLAEARKLKSDRSDWSADEISKVLEMRVHSSMDKSM